MQREFGASHSEKIIVTVARARHEVRDQIVGRVGERLGELLQILVRERIGAAGLFRIDRQIPSVYFDCLLHRTLLLQLQRERERLARAQYKVVARRIKTLTLNLQAVSPSIDCGEVELPVRVSCGEPGNGSFGVSQSD